MSGGMLNVGQIIKDRFPMPDILWRGFDFYDELNFQGLFQNFQIAESSPPLLPHLRFAATPMQEDQMLETAPNSAAHSSQIPLPPTSRCTHQVT